MDEAALYAALCQPGGISAALDVFATEPLPASSPLWTVPDERILLSSHNADLTEDYFNLGWGIFGNPTTWTVSWRARIWRPRWTGSRDTRHRQMLCMRV